MPSYPELPLLSCLVRIQAAHGQGAKANKPAARCLTRAWKGSEGSSAGGEQEVTEGRDPVTQTQQEPSQLAPAFSRRGPDMVSCHATAVPSKPISADDQAIRVKKKASTIPPTFALPLLLYSSNNLEQFSFPSLTRTGMDWSTDVALVLGKFSRSWKARKWLPAEIKAYRIEIQKYYTVLLLHS